MERGESWNRFTVYCSHVGSIVENQNPEFVHSVTHTEKCPKAKVSKKQRPSAYPPPSGPGPLLPPGRHSPSRRDPPSGPTLRVGVLHDDNGTYRLHEAVPAYSCARPFKKTVVLRKLNASLPTISLSSLGMSLNSFLKSSLRDLYVGLSTWKRKAKSTFQVAKNSQNTFFYGQNYQGELLRLLRVSISTKKKKARMVTVVGIGNSDVSPKTRLDNVF